MPLKRDLSLRTNLRLSLELKKIRIAFRRGIELQIFAMDFIKIHKAKTNPKVQSQAHHQNVLLFSKDALSSLFKKRIASLLSLLITASSLFLLRAIVASFIFYLLLLIFWNYYFVKDRYFIKDPPFC
jgi:hypothetical protein